MAVLALLSFPVESFLDNGHAVPVYQDGSTFGADKSAIPKALCVSLPVITEFGLLTGKDHKETPPLLSQGVFDICYSLCDFYVGMRKGLFDLALPFAYQMRRADDDSFCEAEGGCGCNGDVGFPQTHFPDENGGIPALQSLDAPADGIDLACDGSSGDFLYELIYLLSIGPRVVERIGVPADACNDDGAELFDEVVDVHTICRYSPVFRSKAFIWVTILSLSVIFVPFSVSSSNRSMTFFAVPLMRSCRPLASNIWLLMSPAAMSMARWALRGGMRGWIA